MPTTKTAFKRACLYSRLADPEHVQTLDAIASALDQNNIDCVIEYKTASMLDDSPFSAVSMEQCDPEADLLIVIGGDGSFLSAGRQAAEYGLAVLGINRGRLGFLTDVHPNDFDSTLQIMSGSYIEGKRALLEAQVLDQGNPTSEPTIALNEVLLNRGRQVGMLEFDIFVDDEYMCSQHADGMIIATPTGSTAYALSAGGPIVHPHLAASLLMPLCPHRLTSRPLLIPSTSSIRLAHRSASRASAHVSCDGTDRMVVPDGGEVLISPYAKTLRLIHPETYQYFNTLRRKLHWETNLNSIDQ